MKTLPELVERMWGWITFVITTLHVLHIPEERRSEDKVDDPCCSSAWAFNMVGSNNCNAGTTNHTEHPAGWSFEGRLCLFSESPHAAEVVCNNASGHPTSFAPPPPPAWPVTTPVFRLN